jgi:hypothetical protein
MPTLGRLHIREAKLLRSLLAQKLLSLTAMTPPNKPKSCIRLSEKGSYCHREADRLHPMHWHIHSQALLLITARLGIDERES